MGIDLRLQLIIVGAILIILGIIRHFAGISMPKIGFQLVKLPAIAIAGLGVLIVVASLLL